MRPRIIHPRHFHGWQHLGTLAAPCDHDNVYGPSRPLLGVELARHCKVIGDVIVLMQGVEEFALRGAVVGIRSGFLGARELIDAADDEHGATVVHHRVQSVEGNSVVDLVRLESFASWHLNAKVARRTRLVSNHAKRRVRDHRLDWRPKVRTHRILGRDVKALFAKRRRPRWIQLIDGRILWAGSHEQHPIARCRLEYRRRWSDACEMACDISERSWRRIRLLFDARGRAGTESGLTAVQIDELIERLMRDRGTGDDVAR